MIITVTLNPAVDKTYETTRLIPGQVNRMESVKNLAGGKGINVSKVLRQYGYPVKALGFLGGYTGRFIGEYVEKIGALCRFTPIEGETRSSINILSGDGYVTEVLEPGPVISEGEFAAFCKGFEEELGDCSCVILSGSAPKGVSPSVYRELIEQAKKQDKKVFLDTSGDFLREGAKAAPFLLKPNVKELELLVDRRLRSVAEIADAAVFLRQRGISHVLVSMGERGLLYADGDKLLWAKAPKIKAVNTVGCGDSVVAAFAMAYESGYETEELLRFCTGVSAANAATAESGKIPIELAKELQKQVKIERL